MSKTPTGDKLFSGVNNTGEIYPCHRFSVIADVVHTSDKFITGINDTGGQLSLVTTTTAINLFLVTRTRTLWRWGDAKDRIKLKGTNQRYLPPSASDMAADGVIETTMKSCILKHHTHLDQRPLRLPELNNAVFGLK